MCHNTQIKMFQMGNSVFAVATPVVLEADHWPRVTAPRAVLVFGIIFILNPDNVYFVMYI